MHISRKQQCFIIIHISGIRSIDRKYIVKTQKEEKNV